VENIAMKILAHRGWWNSPDEKNSEKAIRRALENGFGIETDLRDHNGAVVISHDMPVGDGLMTLEELRAICEDYSPANVMALNVKADGLQRSVHTLINGWRNPLFFFDMSIPDTLGYFKNEMPVFTRESEFEPTPAFYAESQGIWIDAFLGDWVKPETVERHLANGKHVCLVSPELHGRNHARAWDEWKGLGGENVMICTDFPHLAADHWK
jgi:glycerophosphoryl diester phosphodiesterase